MRLEEWELTVEGESPVDFVTPHFPDLKISLNKSMHQS